MPMPPCRRAGAPTDGGYRLTEATALQLNVNNVFDRQIYTDSHVSQFANIEPGRNFVLTLKHAF